MIRSCALATSPPAAPVAPCPAPLVALLRNPGQRAGRAAGQSRRVARGRAGAAMESETIARDEALQKQARLVGSAARSDLGNAYRREGSPLGHAILSYERAALLTPRDPVTRGGHRRRVAAPGMAARRASAALSPPRAAALAARMERGSPWRRAGSLASRSPRPAFCPRGASSGSSAGRRGARGRALLGGPRRSCSVSPRRDDAVVVARRRRQLAALALRRRGGRGERGRRRARRRDRAATTASSASATGRAAPAGPTRGCRRAAGRLALVSHGANAPRVPTMMGSVMRILVVEDDEEIGRFVVRGLQQEGHHVDWVKQRPRGALAGSRLEAD